MYRNAIEITLARSPAEKGTSMKSQPLQNTISRTFLGSVLGVWFVLALIYSILGGFRGDPSQPPLALGLGVLSPVLLFLVAWYGSARVRHFVASLDLQTITFLQIGRIFGGAFLIQYLLGGLPGVFALPAGWGDVAIALTAPLVAWMLVAKTPSRLSILLVWTVLGTLDLIVAVSLGILTSQSTLGVLAGAMNSAAVVVFPLSLIPTFLVPFYLILHLITLARVRGHLAYPQQSLMKQK